MCSLCVQRLYSQYTHTHTKPWSSSNLALANVSMVHHFKYSLTSTIKYLFFIFIYLILCHFLFAHFRSTRQCVQKVQKIHFFDIPSVCERTHTRRDEQTRRANSSPELPFYSSNFLFDTCAKKRTIWTHDGCIPRTHNCKRSGVSRDSANESIEMINLTKQSEKMFCSLPAGFGFIKTKDILEWMLLFHSYGDMKPTSSQPQLGQHLSADAK